MKAPLRASHEPVHSRRTFVRNMTLGAAYLGSGVAAGLAAEVAEATKGGEKKPGVALMGLGLYSRGELGPALLKTKVCRFAGVVTGSREKGEAWSSQYGFPAKNIWSYDTVHEIAGNPDIDIVYVVTPNGLHPEHVIKVAQAGKHVICEKPMANTAADCDAMISACRKADVRLSIGYRLHFDPYHIELDRLAREKDFGTLTQLSGEHSWTFGKRAWRIEKTLSGGGPMMDVGIYVVQASCRAALGQPVAVTARELPKTNPELFNEVEEAIEWTMEFPGGVTCQGSSSYARNNNFFRAEGSRGWIRLDPAYAYRGIQVQTSRGPLSYPEVPQQALQMDDFASCILTGREPPVSGSLGRDHMAIIDAVYKSAAEGGRRVEVAVA
jgi:glucose-fructose oxidoreductase